MFNESVEAQEQRFITEGTSIDSQGNVQSLSEEQQQWLRENLEEIKKANDDTVPVRSLFLDFSDLREIDDTHYSLGGKIYEDFKLTKEEMKKELTHSSFHYHLKETREWVDKAIKEGRDSWENMPLRMRDDQRLCLKACSVSMFHEDVVRYLKKERAKLNKIKKA
jgi:hypothetical protein